MSDLGEEGERSFLVKWDILITLVIHTWCGRVLWESSGRSAVALRVSVQSCPTLWLHRLQHARLPCPSLTPRAYSTLYPSSRWCHPTISSSIVLFSSCLQSFPTSGSFQMNQFFTSGGQSIGVSASASVLPVNIQDWFPLGWTGLISLQSNGLSRIFSNTTVQTLVSINDSGRTFTTAVPTLRTSLLIGVDQDLLLFTC